MTKMFAIAVVAVTAVSLASLEAAAQSRTAPPSAAPAARSQAAPAQPVGQGTVTKNDEVVARLGDIDVTAEEVRANIALLDPRQQTALTRDPALLSQTVRAILANRLVLREALAKKWDQQPVIVNQLARARERLIMDSYLQSVTMPPESYPSDAEVKSTYDANVANFLVPRQFQLAQIVVTVAKDADKPTEETARRKLDDVVKKVKQPGADFGALARTMSDDTPTAEKDGEIGWVAEPNLRPEIRSQVAGLGKGGLTDPIQLDDGWHVFKLLDTEASHTRSLGEMKDALVQRMRAERSEASRRAYVADLVKQTPSVVNEIALSKLFDSKSQAPSAQVPSR
jgi:peptidylprolyl isomerase